jgi:hypothetical protein
MKKYVYLDLGGLKTKFLGIEYAEPECGEDFCDSCGDCLSCNGGDECLGNEDGKHLWVEYREAAQQTADNDKTEKNEK